MTGTAPSYQPTTSSAVAADVAATVPVVRRRGAGGGTHALTIAGGRPWGQPAEAPLEWPGWMDDANCHNPKRWDAFVPARSTGGPPPECGPCPVASLCLRQGIKTESDGWWGGVYLLDGKSVKHKHANPRTPTPAGGADAKYQPLYDKGLTDAQIALALGVRRQAVGTWRWKNSLPPHNDVVGKRIALEESAAELRAQGVSQAETARRLGTTHSVIRRALARRAEAQSQNEDQETAA